MAQTRKNNRHLKSMEEFKCKSSGLKLFFVTLIVITLSLLFFSRGSASKEVAKAEIISIDLTTPNYTEQQNYTEPTNLTEANNSVEADETVEDIETAESVESIEASENSEIESDYSFEDIDSDSEVISLEDQVYEDFIIPVTEKDIGLIVMAVQHEVGSYRSFYPDADLDTIQQCMARVIINQVLEGRWGNTVPEILFYPGHFMNIERLWKYDPYEETTRKNVLTVLRGEDSLSSAITIEMSFSSSCTFEDSIEIMESQVGPVIPYFWTVTAENRLLIFAESDKVRLAEMIAEASKED